MTSSSRIIAACSLLAVLAATPAAAQGISAGGGGGASFPLTGNVGAIGAVSTDALNLVNTQPATAGNQQWSGRLRFTGSGWKTNATAGPEVVDWVVENVPIQGTADPATSLQFSSQINGQGYTPAATPANGRFTMRSDNYFIGTDNVGSAALRISGNTAASLIPSMSNTTTNFGVTSSGFSYQTNSVADVVYVSGTGFSTYKAKALTGIGVPIQVAIAQQGGPLTAADTNFINYSPGASTGSFNIRGELNMSAWTTPASFTVACTFKDDGGVSRTETLAVTRGSTGAVAAAVTAVDRWYFELPLFRIDSSNTAITCSTTGTFTGSPSYSMWASVYIIQ